MLLEVEASLAPGATPISFPPELSRRPPKLLLDSEDWFYFISVALYGYNLLTERCVASPRPFLQALTLPLEENELLSFKGAFEEDTTAVRLLLIFEENC